MIKWPKSRKRKSKDSNGKFCSLTSTTVSCYHATSARVYTQKVNRNSHLPPLILFPDIMLIIFESVRPNLEILLAFSNVTLIVITLPYPTIDVCLQNVSSPRIFSQ